MRHDRDAAPCGDRPQGGDGFSDDGGPGWDAGVEDALKTIHDTTIRLPATVMVPA
jgi:hypothetical protein